MDTKIQGETLPSTQRPSWLDTIDLVPLDTFKVELNWPPTVDYTICLTLDGFFIKPIDAAKLCDCSVKTLMESGCLCGGR